MQRTKIKVYTDPHFAQTMFSYCDSLMKKELDELQSTNLFAVYATHVAKAAHMSALKNAYTAGGRGGLPQLQLR